MLAQGVPLMSPGARMTHGASAIKVITPASLLASVARLPERPP